MADTKFAWPFWRIDALMAKSGKNGMCLIVLATISLMYFNAYGQSPSKNYPSVNISSPTASSLGKFVDFPVSLHTGVPDISIPIYTVQEGPLQLPISLSHHASGLKVMEPASWVGAGWSLNSGGVVSRNVKGLPDEQVGIDGYSLYSNRGYSNYFFVPAQAPNYAGNVDPRIDYSALSAGKKDGEPDLFTFNFGGYGGKFYFREDLTPVLIPEGDIKIEPMLKSETNTTWTYDYIQGFKITTPDGVKYFFGVTPQVGDTDAIEKSRLYTISDLTYSDVISSWYLYKVESADSIFSINISYRPEEFGYFTVAAKTDASGHGAVTPHKVLMSGVALQQIQFSTGIIDFIAGGFRQDLSRNSISPLDDVNNFTNAAKSLASIRITSNQGTYCTSYNFSYDYFNDNSTVPLPYAIAQHGGNAAYSSDRKRLKLNSLQKLACDASVSEPPYQFYYYDEALVPRRLSFAQDHWGFYNGATTNTTMLPLISTGPQLFHAQNGDNRNAKWPDMRAGALRLIQYPTGGGTEYIYEANRTLVTSNCSMQRTFNVFANVTAGMDGNDGFGTPQTFNLPAPTVYYYVVNKSGVASGSFYVDGAVIASVDTNNPGAENFIYLNAGSHTIQAYNTPDAVYGSGNGVLAYLYEVTSTCDQPREKTVGGLRIKQISKFGGDQGQKLSMKYEYGNSNLYSIPSYVSKYKHPIFKGLDVYPTENGCVPQNGLSSPFPIRYTTSAVSIHPMESVQGYHIGYREVKEIASDGGYTITEYNGNVVLPGGWNVMEDVAVTKIDVNTCTSNDPVYPLPPLAYDFTRGSLRSKKIFDSSGRKLKESSTLEQYLGNPNGAFGVTIANASIGPGIALPVHYELKSGKLLWTTQTEVTTDESGNSSSTVTTTNFNSAYHRMPSSETRTSQNGVIESKYRYVPDLTGCNNGCQSCSDIYLAAASTLYSEYLAKENTCTSGGCVNADFLGWDHPAYSPCSSAVRCKWASWTDYNYRLNKLRVNYTICIDTCKQNNNCIVTGINTSTNEGVKSLFAMEQRNQLNKVETVSWEDNIFQSGAFMDYRPKSGDFSKIYLKDVFTTETSTPVTTFVQSYINAGVVLKDPKYSSQPYLTYVYNNGQPVELTERNGVTTSYIWGFNNTVPIVKSVGSNHTTLNTAYTNSGANLRNDPLLAGAQVTTYTYSDPIVGITTMTDANGRLLTYEYDKLGRLVRIKDHDGKVLEQYEYSYRTN